MGGDMNVDRGHAIAAHEVVRMGDRVVADPIPNRERVKEHLLTWLRESNCRLHGKEDRDDG